MTGSGSRPFRFIAPLPVLGRDVTSWTAEVRRREDLGFNTLAVSDHLSRGWSMEPMAVLSAAAAVTSRVRLMTLVLNNDFRHPVLLHRAVATADVLSGGRVELGLGAGWLAEDYRAAGLPFDPAPVRLARLRESVTLLSRLFDTDVVSFTGRHYRTVGLEALPRAVQRPRPPLLLGGGGPRVLAMAGEMADIVGIHCRLPGGVERPEDVADLLLERVAEKVSWVTEAARQGARPTPELQLSVYLCQVGQRPAPRSTFARLLAGQPHLLAGSPAVLVGDVERCVDLLQERRERLGISYWHLGDDVDAVAPVVARLAGT